MRPPHRSAGHRPHEASMRPSHRPAGHRPHGPSMNPMRPNMNGARPNRSFFIQPHSYETRPFLKSSAVKTQYRAPWVPTVNRNNPPVNRKFSTGRRNFPTVNRKFPTASRKFTTGSTKMHTTDMGRKGKAIKASACWGGSQNNIDDKGYWDSGCSRHMTGNISYLSDFEPFDGGYVKSVNTAKGKNVTSVVGKQGTNDVKSSACWVWRPKIKVQDHVFKKSRSYICKRFDYVDPEGRLKSTIKNMIEDLLLLQAVLNEMSDENQVLLKVPRKNNMYSFDLKNVVPSKGLTCLFAKATNDESNFWHRRLGIKREFSNARIHQQNGVAKRRNRTLIEAARTMLADAKLPVTFWVEAVNTACYVQNRVLVNKSQNKTPYELFNGRTPAIRFLKPFGYHVMILNTLDNLGKFEAKRDEGYFVEYSIPEVPEGSGNTNPTASTSNPPAAQMETLTVEIPFPLDARLISKRVANQEETPSLENILSLINRFEDILGVTTSSDEAIGVEADVSNMEKTISASPTPTLRIHKDHPKKPKKVSGALQEPSWVEAMQEELLQFKIQNVWTLVDYPKWVRPIGTK
nr:retrovirus-related Pol polyprotein from transposon TNT 1-94 [Tanacetum cinerariifolium]